MSHKAMTDAEIKKALECCIIGDCQGCIYGETDQRHCKDDLMQNALNLINRQQAEIERLNRLTDDLVKIADTRKKANFSLLKEKILLTRELKNAKAEAIKEFAERLNNQFDVRFAYVGRLIRTEIDNLVKEMVGEAMYNSPIELISNAITQELNKQTDEAVYRAVQRIGVNVNKDELIKALSYDRQQYQKGYADGVKAVITKIKEETLETFMLQGWCYSEMFLDSIENEMVGDAE